MPGGMYSFRVRGVLAHVDAPSDWTPLHNITAVADKPKAQGPSWAVDGDQIRVRPRQRSGNEGPRAQLMLATATAPAPPPPAATAVAAVLPRRTRRWQACRLPLPLLPLPHRGGLRLRLPPPHSRRPRVPQRKGSACAPCASSARSTSCMCRAGTRRSALSVCAHCSRKGRAAWCAGGRWRRCTR